MNFMYPYVLCALALPLLLAILALYPAGRHSRSWRQLVSAEHEGEIVLAVPLWRRKLPVVLGLPALVLVIFALARPYSGETQADGVFNGRNLLIAIDVSRSMETDDVRPSRLEQARTAAYDLLEALPEERIGLIVFSGEADLVVPLTYDHDALRDAIEQADRGWVAAGGTDFGRVLSCAVETFRKEAARGTNALVILSDGEDTVGTSADLAEEVKKSRLLVMTVGIGTKAGAPIPDKSQPGGLYVDGRGKHVISKLDEESMKAFAQGTGGEYFSLHSGADLEAFARRAADRLDRQEEKGRMQSVPNDCFELFAIPALALLVMSVAASAVWRAPRAAMLPAFLLLCGDPLQAVSMDAARERFLAQMKEGDYEQAVQTIDEAFRDAPSEWEPEWQFARAWAAMKNGNDDEAKRGFSEALLSPREELQVASLYELGNINVRRQFDKVRRLCESEDGKSAAPDIKELKDVAEALKRDVASYDDALSLDPSHRPSSLNKKKTEEFIRLLEEEIKRLEQQNQQQGEGQQDNQQGEGQQDNQQGEGQQNQQQGEGQQDNQQEEGQQNQQQGERDREDGEGENPQSEDDRRTRNDSRSDAAEKDGQEESGLSSSPVGKRGSHRRGRPSRAAEAVETDAPLEEAGSGEDEGAERPAELNSEAREVSERMRAARLLQMHMEEEKGSPLPVRPSIRSPYPPQKDY